MVNRWLISVLCAASAAASPALGETCDMAGLVEPDKRAEVLRSVREAPSARAAHARTNAMWEIWATAPDPHAQALLDEGLDRRAAGDLAGALAVFDALVAYCPVYAEGYNQRAFIRFLQRDYGPALADLDAAIARAPEHYAARAGKALALIGLGRRGEAKTALEQALAYNPWLPERGLMAMLENQDI